MSNQSSVFIRKGLCIAILLVSAMLFYREVQITYSHSITYGGTDLWARIIGSRFLHAGYDPYFTKWRPALGNWLCNPNDTYDRPINGVTATPFLLWIQQPLATNFNHPTIRGLWWLMQQLILVAIITISLYSFKKSKFSQCIVLLTAGLCLNTPFWFYHSERGQIYVLYSLWIAVLYVLWFGKGNRSIIMQAVWLAAGILMRPFLIVFILPTILFHSKKKSILLLLATALTSILLLLVSGTLPVWRMYFDAMHIYNEIAMWFLKFPQATTPVMPKMVDGSTNITIYHHFNELPYMEPIYIFIVENGHRPPRIFYPIACALSMIIFIGLVYWNNRLRINKIQSVILGTLLYICAEVFTPYRASYNLIIWLPAILLSMGYIFSKVSLFNFKETAAF